jgi:hypothetical protein
VFGWHFEHSSRIYLRPETFRPKERKWTPAVSLRRIFRNENVADVDFRMRLDNALEDGRVHHKLDGGDDLGTLFF